MIAQELFSQLTKEEQEKAIMERTELLHTLYDNELLYTQELYEKIGLVDEVNKFIRYNANKACMNLGFDAEFAEEQINPIVENGMKTETKNHDFFSVKGNGYVKATKVEPLRDEDFIFNK